MPDPPVARLDAQDPEPIEMPIPGPGMPRERGGPPAYAVWLIPAAVVVATALAILCGALWR